ncbi:hypothetical protein M407DRAFT_227027 [Tulasnella calospora MUT 4182]|uniref:Uncharacterized protein n=1 Tax=Tulasnella calospora MUT 4182 TaxID=1051891 RepID=A0A0C3MJM7_9AGAM|nr:hypothetical protein M407DRAFT_227027 [Tulasnella calospora MUT 4182]
MAKSVPWPMPPEAIFQALNQMPYGSGTPHQLERLALTEVYSMILYSLNSRPLKTFSPDATVDWIKLLPSRRPSIELRTKMQILKLRYFPQASNLLLGLYYLLLLPIGQPVGHMRASQNSSEIDCFRQCLRLCHLQHGMSGDPVTPLHGLAEELMENAVIDIHGFRHPRNIASKERSCLDLAKIYGWLVLGPKGIPTFPLWEAFLDSIQRVVDNLPLHEETKRLAIACLDRISKDVTKEQNSLGFTLPNLRLGFQSLPADELAERQIREGKDARLRKVLERSWTMVPPPLEWTELRNKGESTTSMGITTMAAETDPREFSTPMCLQASEPPLARLPSFSDDASSDAGDMPREWLSGRGSPTTHSAGTFSTLQSTSRTTNDYLSIALSSFRSQQWLLTPPSDPTSQRCLGETGPKLTSNNLQAMKKADAPMPPAHQLLPREYHPGLFDWVLRVGKGVANAIGKVPGFEDELIVKDFDRTLTETKKEGHWAS